MTFRFRLILGAALLFLAANLFAATEERSIHKTFPLNEKGTISVKNVQGDVTIRVWEKNEVDLRVTKRGPSQNLDLVEIAIESKPDVLRVESKYPRFRENTDVTVTYELTVPARASLNEVNNVNGGIDIIGVEGEIGISTVNGPVDISGIKSGLSAETVNGTIHAKWTEFPQRGEVTMRTVNGRLGLQLPGNVNADVQASSMNGSIHTDYPITVHRGFLSHKVEGRIGQGGATIELHTINGSIDISKY
jgi:Toastrack DUF4097